MSTLKEAQRLYASVIATLITINQTLYGSPLTQKEQAMYEALRRQKLAELDLLEEMFGEDKLITRQWWYDERDSTRNPRWYPELLE